MGLTKRQESEVQSPFTGPPALGTIKHDHATKDSTIYRGELGQHINKVSTCVTIRHVPTGTSVTASDSRSQSMNRQLALERLLEEFERRKIERKQARLAEISKARRQRAKRSLGTKRKLVKGKRRRGETKKLRGRVG